MPRVERLERDLEHDLDPAALVERARAGGAVQLAPSNAIRPEVGSCRPATQRPIGGLAAAGLTRPAPHTDPDSTPNETSCAAGPPRRALRYTTSRLTPPAAARPAQRRERASRSPRRPAVRRSATAISSQRQQRTSCSTAAADSSGAVASAALLRHARTTEQTTSSRPLSHPDRNAGDPFGGPGIPGSRDGLHDPRVGVPGTVR